LSDGELINFTNMGADCGTAGPTAKSYFEILEDTLIGLWLPAYRRRPKRRVNATCSASVNAWSGNTRTA